MSRRASARVMSSPVSPRRRRSAPFWLQTLCFIVIGLVLGAAAGVALSTLQKPQYEASAELFLATTQPFDPLKPIGAPPSADNTRYIESQTELLTSDNVLGAASRALPDHPSLAGLRKRVTALSDETSNVLTVIASAGDPRAAAARADAVATAYRKVAADNVTRVAKAAAAQQQGAAAADILAAGAAYGDGVFQYDPAQLPTAPILPSKSTNATLGALAGVLLGAGFAMWRWTRRPVELVNDPTAILGAPYLGTIRAGSAGRKFPTLENGQSVLTALEFAYEATLTGSLLILGAQPRINATGAIVSLTAGAVNQGREVVVVDADRDGALTRMAGATRLPEGAMAQLADGSATVRELGQVWEIAPGRSVSLISCPPGSQRTTRAALARLSSEKGLALIAGPTLPTPEAFGLAGCVDAVILVVDLSATDDELLEVRGLVDLAGSRIAGFVIVQQPSTARNHRPLLPSKAPHRKTGVRA